MTAVRAIAVIPHYNHEQTIVQAVQEILAQGLACIVADDASAPAADEALQQLESTENVTLIRRPVNGGKGAAVIDGLREAQKQGFTHALQIDADLQHQANDIPAFLTAAGENPAAAVCANPIYGDDAPKSRRYGREITNFWIWVNTGTRGIKDGMCGFRLYPLEKTLAVINSRRIGLRMDFDTEILVQLHWAGVPLVWIDSPVRYTADGVSHFRMVKDNIDISKMHARLFFKGISQRLRRGR